MGDGVQRLAVERQQRRSLSLRPPPDDSEALHLAQDPPPPRCRIEVSDATRSQAVFMASANLEIQTREPIEMVDLTDYCSGFVAGHMASFGHFNLFCRHTTCGLLVNEDERGFHEDLTRVLDQLAPRGDYWAHDDLTRRSQNLEDEMRVNGYSHVRASLVANPSLIVPVVDGTLALGRWQRIFLVELDGPRSRSVMASIWGAPTPPPRTDPHPSRAG